MDVVLGIWQTSVPLIVGALAAVLSQRVGIWHLGLGGLISMGAFLGVVGTKETGSVGIGVLAAVIGTVLLSVLMWFAIDQLEADAVVVGIGMNALGVGGTVLGTVVVYGAEGAVTSPEGLPKAFPDASGQLGQISVISLLTPAVIVALWLVISRTRFGLQLTAVGEHPFAARSVGISASKMRFVALVAGGVLCAFAGLELSMGTLTVFTPNMESGRGLIAFAAVILAMSRPILSAAVAVAFGAIGYLGTWAQINLPGAPAPLMLMLPYVAVVAAVALSGVAQARAGGR